MSALTDQILGYYQNLLIAQYANKPKAFATIGALLGGTDGSKGLIAGGIYNAVRDGFDINTAVGKQLDVLGEIIGVSRYFSTLDVTKVFLPLVAYADPDVGTLPGIATYEDAVLPPATYTMTYEDFVANTLSDADYRRVLQFRAAVQSCDYAYSTLDAICYNFFAGNVNLIVTGSMAITYQHLTSDTDDLFEIINQMGLLPTPAGFTVSVAEVGSF
jgi:hypothetical protein